MMTDRVSQLSNVGNGLVECDIPHRKSIVHIVFRVLLALLMFECEQCSPLDG